MQAAIAREAVQRLATHREHYGPPQHSHDIPHGRGELDCMALLVDWLAAAYYHCGLAGAYRAQ